MRIMTAIISYVRLTAMVCMFFMCIASPSVSADVLPTRGLREVNHSSVELQGGFWGLHQDIHHKVTVPHALDCLEKAGHVTNFDKAAGTFDGPLRGNHAFDSDIHKALEGALYSLQHYDNKPLAGRVESIIDRIVAAQQPDGFLISCFIVKDQAKRWENLRMQHQMYNAGHFFEMAIEHHQLTGDDKVLNAAKRFANHIDGIFGPGKRYDVGGHQEIELALIKLYRVTGDRRYLELSKFFLDERGHIHGKERKRFDPNTLPPHPPKVDHLPKSERRRALFLAKWSRRSGRMQDHKPLVEQDATGHAVRAGYTYSAMADIVRYMGAPDYAHALDRIWEDVVYRKMYITGGVGTAQYHDEGYGDPYLLPNNTYCESCAGIAHVLWQHRMATLKGHTKYADVMELALYNGAISGLSIEGDAFFYQNPLQSKGGKRSSWIGLACCPTNFTRFTPQVGGFMYAVGKESIYVNLYAAGTASTKTEKGITVKIDQQTDYPWDGNIKLTVTTDTS
ncbi:MAG: glycoside hydrolase family 127 protein [Planctomycetota bacterium]|nr:MAG: glycoside hydrolase family 127 protein [Planctomycetota bacterium]